MKYQTMRAILSVLFAIALPVPSHVVMGQSSAGTDGAKQTDSRTQLRGFADVVVSGSSEKNAPVSFGTGQYDLYMTSKLSDRLSFLSEVVFEYDDGYVVDVERVIVTYALNNYIRVSAGKHHTPIGYWNNAYHHGAMLQPGIYRPQMFRFEDEGGVLPIHTTGLLIAGRDLTKLHLGFDAMIGNGIGSEPSVDDNQSKSTTLAVHAQVTANLLIGASWYRDRIAATTPGLAETPVGEELNARLVGGFINYKAHAIELMAEWQRSRHLGLSSGIASNTDALYVHAGYRIGNVVPYTRVDALTFPGTDPYYHNDNYRQALLGVRYDMAATAVAKMELARRRVDGRGTVSVLNAQLAVGF